MSAVLSFDAEVLEDLRTCLGLAQAFSAALWSVYCLLLTHVFRTSTRTPA